MFQGTKSCQPARRIVKGAKEALSVAMGVALPARVIVSTEFPDCGWRGWGAAIAS
jgi:hypothetical protein